jgi:hypothetical protein
VIEVTEKLHSLALEFNGMVLEKGDVMAKAHTAHSFVRILLVDDFEPWRQQVCSILRARPGRRVIAVAADGLEAV